METVNIHEAVGSSFEIFPALLYEIKLFRLDFDAEGH